VTEERNKRWKAERLKDEKERQDRAALQPHEYTAIEEVWKSLNAKREADGKPPLVASKPKPRGGYFGKRPTSTNSSATSARAGTTG